MWIEKMLKINMFVMFDCGDGVLKIGKVLDILDNMKNIVIDAFEPPRNIIINLEKFIAIKLEEIGLKIENIKEVNVTDDLN